MLYRYSIDLEKLKTIDIFPFSRIYYSLLISNTSITLLLCSVIAVFVVQVRGLFMRNKLSGFSPYVS